MGRRARRSQERRTSGRIPLPSPPMTMANAPVKVSASKGWASGVSSNPTTQMPRCFNRSMAWARLLRAIRRCSVAPAEAFTTAGVISTASLNGSKAPWTPTPSAVRISVPTFCGSCKISKIRINGGEFCSAE